jgi:hypothetical protein
MGLLDKAKAAAEQAAAKAKEGVEDVQTKRELGQAYNELGKAAFELIEGGEISHPRLQELAQKVRALEERASGDQTVAESASNGGSDGHDPSQPPAMPT